MDQAAAKRTLQELIKNEELGNKKCVDCGNPNPQWATIRSVLTLTRLGYLQSSLAFSVLLCFCVYHVPVCTEALVFTSGKLAFLTRGVHVDARRLTTTGSFVRSVSMDTWQEEQIKRMQVSSNDRCCTSSPAVSHVP